LLRFTAIKRNKIKSAKDEKMTHLFEPTVINGMKLSNRFVRSATWEGMASDDGREKILRAEQISQA